MSLEDYDGLKQSIEDHLDDALSGQIDDFIDLAEARHKREIRIRDMLSKDPITISEGDRAIALPADFLDHKYFRILTTSGSVRRYFPDLEQVANHVLTQRSVNAKRRPSVYAIHTEIEFDSESDKDYSAEHFYYVKLTPLSDTDQTNALLDLAPDVYLYAALLASAPFLINDERLATWEKLYVGARDSLNRSQWESKRGGPLISRVIGGIP